MKNPDIETPFNFSSTSELVYRVIGLQDLQPTQATTVYYFLILFSAYPIYFSGENINECHCFVFLCSSWVRESATFFCFDHFGSHALISASCLNSFLLTSVRCTWQTTPTSRQCTCLPANQDAASPVIQGAAVYQIFIRWVFVNVLTFYWNTQTNAVIFFCTCVKLNICFLEINSATLKKRFKTKMFPLIIKRPLHIYFPAFDFLYFLPITCHSTFL